MSAARCCKVLVERQFPISEVVALASTRSVGTEVSFGDGILKVKALDYFDFKGTDIVPDERRRRHRQGMGAQDRRPGLHRDRQFQRLAHGPRRCRWWCRRSMPTR